MQIREIHIERFGKFLNCRMVPVLPGLNVIYGRNEFGKTTLLEFVRWVLFGFEKKRKGMNPYEPVDGGERAGTLMCERSNGETVFITRKGGTLEGEVTVQAADLEGSGQAHLETYLGHASRKIFKNIYAFALDELQDMDSLLEEEIKNKLLGAGMGLGQVSLTDVEKEINKRRDEVFKLRGSNPTMNQHYREFKKRQEELRARSSEISQYDELNKKIWLLEQKRKTGEAEADQLETRRRNLELRRDLFPDFIELEDQNPRREQLAEVPAMNEESMLSFEKIQAKQEDLSQRLEQERAKLKQLNIRREPISFNPALLERESEIMQLRQLTELVKSAQEDRHAVQKERDQLEEKIRAEMEGIGQDWEEERILDLDWDDADKQFVQKQEQTLYRSEQAVINVRNRLELHQEQIVTGSPPPSPLGLKMVAGVLAAVGLAGVAFAGYVSNAELGFFMGVLLAAAAGLFFWLIRNQGKGEQVDLLENLLQDKLKKAASDMEADTEAWRQWVQDRGLDPEISPALFRELQIHVRAVKEWSFQKKNLDERIDRMNLKEDEAEALVALLAEFAGKMILTNDLLVNIEMLCRLFDETRDRFNQCRDLDAQISEQTGRVDGIAAQLDSQQESLDHLLRSAGVDSEEGFVRQWNRAQAKQSLDLSIREIQKRIHTRVGLGEAYEKFMASMRDTDPEQLEREWTEVAPRLDHLHEEQDRMNQEIGRLRGEAEQLASREDLASLQNELGAEKEQLMNGAREWATLTLALNLMDRAKVQYEKNRQPQVFQAASRMFSKITENNYRGVEKPLESDEFRIVQQNGSFISPVQLSRGPREQLSLSMRFGLIEDYETRAEPLPILMDDVLVNFDDVRREHVLDILRDFARDRQVIILSCHERLLETYLKYGAKQVNLQKE